MNKKVVFVNAGYGVGGAGIAGTRLFNTLHDRYDMSLHYLSYTFPNTTDIRDPRFIQAHYRIPLAQEIASRKIHGSYHPPLLSRISNPTWQSMISMAKRSIPYRVLRVIKWYVKRGQKIPSLFTRQSHDVSDTHFNLIGAINPDIVHLHWIVGLLHVQHIKRMYDEGKTIVWTMHDMWPYTGGCHYNWTHTKSNEFCDKYTTQCGDCPYFYGNKHHDDAYETFEIKQKYLHDVPITFVGPAKWAVEQVQRSALFDACKAVHIPNPYDIDVFCPYDKQASRRVHGLPERKKLILFGNTYARLKGGFLLSKALHQLPFSKHEVALVSMGDNLAIKSKYDLYNMGMITDEPLLAQLYSACDVMAVPSVMDIGPSTAIEALLCGTPVVAFNAYGPAEYVLHKKSGYLARPYNAQDFMNGLEYILTTQHYEAIAHTAREHTASIFDSKRIAQLYYDVYQENDHR